MKRLIFFIAAVVLASSLCWLPARASPEVQVAISVTPIYVDFGTALPGKTIVGTELTIANTGSATVKVTTEIIEDIEFYGKYLKLNGDYASDWTATISTDGSPTTVTTRLEEVPSYLEPGSYRCTVIFWAEEEAQ